MYGLGRVRATDETSRAAALYPVTPAAAVRTNRYWWQGGAFLDQGQTGTCVAFACSHRLADATIRRQGITHDFAIDLYRDSTGDSSLQQGTNAVYVCAELLTRGLISEYRWVTTPQDLADTLLTLGPVLVGINWYEDMFYPQARYGNQYLDVSGPLAGGHEVVINGVNLEPASGPPFYRLKNSWGTSWGKNGTARVAKQDLDHLLFNEWGDAVLIKEVHP